MANGHLNALSSNSAERIVRRLKRDHPKIAEALARGEFPSARAAGRMNHQLMITLLHWTSRYAARGNLFTGDVHVRVVHRHVPLWLSLSMLLLHSPMMAALRITLALYVRARCFGHRVITASGPGPARCPCPCRGCPVPLPPPGGINIFAPLT